MSFKVKAIYEYKSAHDDDLSFGVNQIITITDEEDADWYGGEYVDESGVKHEGIFPRNFVEKFEPTAPPRPARSRPKRDTEPSTPATEVSPPAAAELALPPPELTAIESYEEPHNQPFSQYRLAVDAAKASVASEPMPASPVKIGLPPTPAPKAVEAPHNASLPSKPAGGSKLPPTPAVSEKPTSNSFKDRIAAFNKSAPPPMPFKPSGLAAGSSNFIKKPFVAPPPSRNSYVVTKPEVPMTKVYRRDEDPEIKEREAESLESAERAGIVPGVVNESVEGDEEQPKAMTLKERLALLRQQQMEQAARHADAAVKKEKSKRPLKKRIDSTAGFEEGESGSGTATALSPLERWETGDVMVRQSLDEAQHPRVAHAPRRKSSKDPEPRDGNEADMSGAGETTEGLEDFTEREESDEALRHDATLVKEEDAKQNEEEEADEEDEEEPEPDLEALRKQQLRERMAKMSGGMGMPGMFGMVPMSGTALAAPKKASPSSQKLPNEDLEQPRSPTQVPPVPTMMALPGLSRVRNCPNETPPPKFEAAVSNVEDENESHVKTPDQETVAPPLGSPHKAEVAPPPIPAGRPAPPPVPTDARPPPPPPLAEASLKSPSEGSISDDELSERPVLGDSESVKTDASPATRAPPPLPPIAVPLPPVGSSSPRSPPLSRPSCLGEPSPGSPQSAQASSLISKRANRPPPPVPGLVSALSPAQTRPLPPPPPPGPLSRTSTADSNKLLQRPRSQYTGVSLAADEGEGTEYEGDYDTDIAPSVPYKDALKSHQRDSSHEGPPVFPRSDTLPSLPAPIPSAGPPRTIPPPVPSQLPPPPDNRRSIELMPRTALSPPSAPSKETARYETDGYDLLGSNRYPAQSTSPQLPAVPVTPAFVSTSAPPSAPPLAPRSRRSGDAYSFDVPSFDTSSYGSSQASRAPAAAPPSNRARASFDIGRTSTPRRSVDVTRPSLEAGFVANDIDLADRTGWWLRDSLPPQLQGRKDLVFESEESKNTDPHRRGKTTVTRDIYVLFQDYSQTIIQVRFDPQDSSDVQIEQRHQPPPRTLRQDQLEESYERFGRAIGEAAVGKKDTVVGDGTPFALIHELLRPYKDALCPVGTRAYGALVYSNLANASTMQNDEIRPGDIISIRNAKFQGKHGAMHAKYSIEVGKPDHVAVVAEWDGTKKKVRAWEQGRESRKVKMESFKLDDLRSGEVKIWRVMARSWIGWGAGN